MMLRKRLQISECLLVDVAAVLTNAAQQCFSRGAERPVLPTGVLFAGIAPPALQDPLQRVIYGPPVLIELGYDVI